MKVHELIIDFYECGSDLNNKEFLLKTCMMSIKKVKAHIVNQLSHSYNPQGISIFLLLAESHIHLETWPEFDYATLNIFLCNEKMDPKKVLSIFKKELKPKRIIKKEFVHLIK